MIPVSSRSDVAVCASVLVSSLWVLSLVILGSPTGNSYLGLLGDSHAWILVLSGVAGSQGYSLVSRQSRAQSIISATIDVAARFIAAMAWTMISLAVLAGGFSQEMLPLIILSAGQWWDFSSFQPPSERRRQHEQLPQRKQEHAA